MGVTLYSHAFSSSAQRSAVPTKMLGMTCPASSVRIIHTAGVTTAARTQRQNGDICESLDNKLPDAVTSALSAASKASSVTGTPDSESISTKSACGLLLMRSPRC
ncbi:Uncharacterised protein [Vibrio cholerae]|nr:Uncharacterised protein [Vibrio cholerae]